MPLFPPLLHPQAQSAKLIGEAVQQNPAFITLRKIEAAREIAHTISTSANKVYLPSDSLLLNLGQLGEEIKATNTAKK